MRLETLPPVSLVAALLVTGVMGAGAVVEQAPGESLASMNPPFAGPQVAEGWSGVSRGNLTLLRDRARAHDQSLGETPVLVIAVDTLRADHVSCVADDLVVPAKAETPNICELADSGYTFTRAYSQAPVTLPSFSSMFTSRYPSEIGTYYNGYHLPERARTLAEIMDDREYNTSAFISLNVLSKAFDMDQGFDRYSDPRGPWWFETAGSVNERVLPHVRDEFGPRDFTWVHYSDPHEPYISDERRENVRRYTLDQLRQHPDLPKAREYYREETEYVDREIGRLLDTLRERGMYDRTLIVFVADHGENLAYNGWKMGHVNDLHSLHVHVPMIVKFPFQRRARTVAEPVGLIDLRPTILDYLDIDAENTGQSVFGPHRKRWIYSETYPQSGQKDYAAGNKQSITDGERRIILHDNGKTEFFRMAADYYERHPVRGNHSEYVKTIRERGPVLELVDSALGESREEIRERLEDLGYAE